MPRPIWKTIDGCLLRRSRLCPAAAISAAAATATDCNNSAAQMRAVWPRAQTANRSVLFRQPPARGLLRCLAARHFASGIALPSSPSAAMSAALMTISALAAKLALKSDKLKDSLMKASAAAALAEEAAALAEQAAADAPPPAAAKSPPAKVRALQLAIAAAAADAQSSRAEADAVRQASRDRLAELQAAAERTAAAEREAADFRSRAEEEWRRMSFSFEPEAGAPRGAKRSRSAEPPDSPHFWTVEPVWGFKVLLEGVPDNVTEDDLLTWVMQTAAKPDFAERAAEGQNVILTYSDNNCAVGAKLSLSRLLPSGDQVRASWWNPSS